MSFPFKLRYLLACYQKLTNKALKIFLQTISSFQKKKAKKSGLCPCQKGAVQFIQRFGSALNLNIHSHALLPDGVFVEANEGYVFSRQSQPTHEELIQLAALSVANKSGFGERAGKSIQKLGAKRIEFDPEGQDPYSANVGGFSLNAQVWIAGSDRKKLEQLIRSMAGGHLELRKFQILTLIKEIQRGQKPGKAEIHPLQKNY